MTWARAVASSLVVDARAVPAEGNYDAATYLTFFDQLLNRLEGASTEFECLIDEASRNLLAVAVERLFSNLRRLQPDFAFETVTESVDDEQSLPLSHAVSDAVNCYVDRLKRSTAEETSEEEGEEEDEDAGGDASA